MGAAPADGGANAVVAQVDVDAPAGWCAHGRGRVAVRGSAAGEAPSVAHDVHAGALSSLWSLMRIVCVGSSSALSNTPRKSVSRRAPRSRCHPGRPTRTPPRPGRRGLASHSREVGHHEQRLPDVGGPVGDGPRHVRPRVPYLVVYAVSPCGEPVAQCFAFRPRFAFPVVPDLLVRCARVLFAGRRSSSSYGRPDTVLGGATTYPPAALSRGTVRRSRPPGCAAPAWRTWNPPLGVRTRALPPVRIPQRLSRSNAAKPRPSSRLSTSRTSGQGAPVAIATFLSGRAFHHARITAGSVVASLTPCGVSGSLVPVCRGGLAILPPRTGVPRQASSRGRRRPIAGVATGGRRCGLPAMRTVRRARQGSWPGMGAGGQGSAPLGMAAGAS